MLSKSIVKKIIALIKIGLLLVAGVITGVDKCQPGPQPEYGVPAVNTDVLQK